MSDTKNVSAVELLKTLDANEVEKRIDALDSESAALRTLLRSLRAKERARRLREARPADSRREASR